MYATQQIRQWIGSHSFESSKAEKIINSIAVDSRCVEKKSLFFALAGESTTSRNGHEFLFDAVAAGATCLCIDAAFQGQLPENVDLLRVTDPLKSLQHLARSYLNHCGTEVIAITGSIGKTTTKQLIWQIVSPHVQLACTQKSQNGRLGVPLTILNQLRPHHFWILLEMGMDRPGQLSQLIQIASPKIAVVTAIEPAHMDEFVSLDELAKAKGEIFLGPDIQVGFINRDSNCHHLLKKIGRCEKNSFSIKSRDNADLALLEKNGEISICENGTEIYRTQKPLNFAPQHLSCLAAAVAIARHLNLSFDQIVKSWAQLKPPQGRFIRYHLGDFQLIDDSYNASPTSVIAALRALPKKGLKGRRLAVLAKMEELGPFCAKAHEDVGRAAYSQLDALICLDPMGDLIADVWCQEKKPLWRVANQNQILDLLPTLVGPFDILLIKGSRKWGLDRLIEPLLKILASKGLSQWSEIGHNEI